MTEYDKNAPQFFMTNPQPCPYMANRFERKVFTYIAGKKSSEINSILTQGGFRRSQNIAYRPICDNCQACVSVRIVVNDFIFNQSQRRVLSKNQKLTATINPAKTTLEQYSLFREYLNTRHAGGGMNDMSENEYRLMVEDTTTDTKIIEYRCQDARHDQQNQMENQEEKQPLIAVALTDIISDGLSMVYSFFSPQQKNASLGMYIILDHVKLAKSMGLPYVYLGYWVDGSDKMGYKTCYQPQEHLSPQGWVRHK